MTFEQTSSTLRLALGATALTLVAGAASADIVHPDDVIIQGSLCVGFDCVNGESFGFDTLRLKENNLRIHFDDTSNSASFPRNDWRITINDTTNGGQSRFSVDDATAGRTPFTIEAGAAANSLYVDSTSRIGLKTSTPVVELHIRDGDTPTVRLEQDGSSGFTPQTWDMAGNEANFFVRDVTNGSRLSFKIRPGALTDSLTIQPDGDIGIGTNSPATGAQLHVENTGGQDTDDIVLTDAGAIGVGTTAPTGRMELANNGTFVFFRMTASDAAIQSADITYTNGGGGQLRYNIVDADGHEMSLDANGNMVITGSLTTAGGVTPDYVFAPDYELMPLAEVEKFIIDNQHLPKIPSAAEIAVTGLNITEMQMALLEKVEELTLHTIAQQKMIDTLQERLEAPTD